MIALNKYIAAFFLFSFLGWVWESIYCTIRERKWANRGFLFNAEEKELIEAAMLHDPYPYDWHDRDPSLKPHCFKHPGIACDNAVKHFGVTEKVQEAIRSHM